MAMDISVVVPIYNAEDIVEHSIERITRTLNQSGLNYEILLRDDGSTGGSRKLLEHVDLRYSQVNCFYNPVNEGLGSTLRKLFNDAQGSNIVYCDCDLPYGAEAIPVVLDELEPYDIVVASRYRGAPNEVRFLRKITSRLYYLLCKLLFNIPVADIGSGLVAMRKQVLDKMVLEAKGFDIHAELYTKASRQGFRIEEIPFEAGDDGVRQGSFCVWKHGLRVFMETVWLRIKLFRGIL